MRTEPVILVGAGGHALVVVDSLLAAGWHRQSILVLDSDPSRTSQELLGGGVTIFDPAKLAGALVHVCIGDNSARDRICAQVLRSGGEMLTVVHPRAVISSHATVGAGSFVAAGAIVAPKARIGQGCIINHSAVVDHDCAVDDFVHIAPGATLAGAVRVGKRSLVGAGARILPAVSVGSGSTLGAGAVVLEDVADNQIYVGVPARKLQQ